MREIPAVAVIKLVVLPVVKRVQLNYILVNH